MMIGCSSAKPAEESGQTADADVPAADVKSEEDAKAFAAEALDSAIGILDGIVDETVDLDVAADKIQSLMTQWDSVGNEYLSDTERKIRQGIEDASFVIQDLNVLKMTGSSFDAAEQLKDSIELLKGLKSS